MRRGTQLLKLKWVSHVNAKTVREWLITCRGIQNEPHCCWSSEVTARSEIFCVSRQSLCPPYMPREAEQRGASLRLRVTQKPKASPEVQRPRWKRRSSFNSSSVRALGTLDWTIGVASHAKARRELNQISTSNNNCGAARPKLRTQNRNRAVASR